MSEFGKPSSGRVWPVWIRRIVRTAAGLFYFVVSVGAVKSMTPEITARLGEGWSSMAVIAAAGFTPFVAVFTGWIVDRLLTWSASGRLENELMWYDRSWSLSWSWMRRHLAQMDGIDYAAFERRQLAAMFLLGLSIPLFGPLIDMSPWWALAPVALYAIGAHWVIFG